MTTLFENSRLAWFVVLLQLAAVCLVLPPLITAQCNSNGVCSGDNAVYNSSGSQTNAHSFIDASQINTSDICLAINGALQQLENSTYGSAVGGTIDARNFSASPGSTITCSIDPWKTWRQSQTTYPSSTILLPSGVIGAQTAWFMPAFTKLLGQGACIPGSGSNSCTTLTTIRALNSMPWMIQMGSDSGDGICPGGAAGLPDCNGNSYNCNGVKIEHLVLDGNNTASGGILNQYSQELSYVNDVGMINLLGIGLLVTNASDGNGDGDNSGPYSNLYISTGGKCVQITGLNQTRGVHGLNCSASLIPVQANLAAIEIDSQNDTIEDVSVNFTGTTGQQSDGIQLNGTGNVLLNISGNAGQPAFTNLVHIKSNATHSTIAGVANATTGTVTVQDDLAGGSSLLDPTVGLYIVGDSVGNGTARFTTSNTIPTWLVGTNSPVNGTSCTVGDLYSDTAATPALYACTSSSGTWYPIGITQ